MKTLHVHREPLRFDVTATYEDNILAQRSVTRSISSTPARAAIFTAMALLLAGILTSWRLMEVQTTSKHRQTMQIWASTHHEAAAYIPHIQARPLLEGVVLALLVAGLAAGLVAGIDILTRRRTHRFLIGETRDCDLPVTASVLPSPRFPLIEHTPAGFQLAILPNMSGWIDQKGQRTNLAAILQSARKHPVYPNTKLVRLSTDTTCLICIEHLSILVEDATRATLQAPTNEE